MERTLTESGTARAQAAVEQLVGLIAPGNQQRLQELKRVASDSRLREFIADPGIVTQLRAEGALRSLSSANGQVLEVWSAKGEKLIALAVPDKAGTGFPPSMPPTGHEARLSQAGNLIVSDIIVPIRTASVSTAEVSGHLVLRRPVTAASSEVINKLMGHGARIHLGLANGGWTDLKTIITPSPVEQLGSGAGMYRSNDGEWRIAAAAKVEGTPWMAAVEFPRSVFLAPAMSFLYRTGIIALLLVLVAGLVTRLVARRITGPLSQLTAASESIAAGDYSQRVKPVRQDEIGRLGHAFNAMVAQVEEAHEHLMLAVQGSEVGIWQWSADTDRVYLSEQWKRMLLYEKEELEGSWSMMRDLVHPDDWESVIAGIRGCLHGESFRWESEHRLRRKDGSYIWVLARGVVSSDSQTRSLRLAGTSIDITAQKDARDQAVARERHAAFVADVAVALTEGAEFRDMLKQCAKVMVQHLDARLARVWTASSTEPVLVLQASAGIENEIDRMQRVPLGAHVVGRVAADRRPVVDNDVDPSRYVSEGMLRDEHLKSYAAFPLVLGDRLIGVMSMFGRRPLDEGTLTALGSVSRTVALGIERKRLEESRRRFEDLLESATDFVTIGRPVGPPLYVNRAARQALEVGADEHIESLFEFRSPAFKLEFEREILPAATREGTWKGQTEYISRSGRKIPVSQVTIVHKNAKGKVEYLSTISRDISDELRLAQERERLEEQMSKAQRIEAIGQLAGGLAHDFNNLLTVIMGYTNVLGDGFPNDDPRLEDIEQIRRAGERASQLTRQLLAFSRKQILNPIVLNPNELIEGMRPMLRRLMGESNRLVVNYASDVGAIKIDPAQMELILVNLAVNARDAMPKGGTLTIETANVALDEEFCRAHLSVEPGAYVRIAVSDTGIGIDEETRKRVFEPFFTTKSRDKGTGLGLATVFGIVKQSGGSVWVYSEPGLGASFKIFLPIAGEPKPAESTQTARAIPKGSGTVLVVEDEPGVRGLVQTVLTRAGYSVLITAGPTEAIRIAGDPGQKIDLLLTDVVMPDMNGAVLAEEIRRTRPELRVMFMSGFADDIIEHHGVLASGSAFLQKPFTMQDLTQKIRQVLGNPSTAAAADRSV